MELSQLVYGAVQTNFYKSWKRLRIESDRDSGENRIREFRVRSMCGED
jgi:hypothetical protein